MYTVGFVREQYSTGSLCATCMVLDKWCFKNAASEIRASFRIFD